jgi:hypothetical protein
VIHGRVTIWSGPSPRFEREPLDPSANTHMVDAERIVNIDTRRAADDARQVVIADQQNGRDRGAREATDALGERALHGRVRVARLKGVAGEEDRIDPLGDGEGDELVEPREEIAQATRQPGRRIGAPVVLDTQVEIREVEEFHLSPDWPRRGRRRRRAIARTGE